jgi:drug/metabolite transporter (DMT)-like permease
LNSYAYLLTTMAFFGSAFASSEVVVGSMPHQVAALLRFGGGAIILALFLIISQLRSRGEPLTRQQLLRAAGVGLIGVFAYNVLFFWGLSLAPAADGSIIVPVLSPVITNIILISFRQEKPSARRIVGLSTGLAGAVIFFIGASDGGGDRRLEGDLVYLLGAVAWALYSIASKNVLKGIAPLRATTYGTTVGAIGLLLVAAPAMPSVHWAAVPTTTWLNVAYLAIGPTAIAYLFYFRGLRNVSPSTATMVMFTVPIFGVACSVAFLGESFTAAQLVGGVIMLAGALLAVTNARRKRVLEASLAPGKAATEIRSSSTVI